MSLNKKANNYVSTARLRYAKLGPRRVRAIADLIRNKPVLDAQSTLMLMPNRGAGVLLKVLRSAVANAKQGNPNLSEATLWLQTVTVDQGPPFMRKWRPRAHGRATPIKRLSSHVEIGLVLAD